MYALAPAQYFPVGLGSVQSANQAVSIGTSAASSAASILATTGVISASAVPIIGAALAGVALGVSALIKNSGCGQTCIQASEYADEAGKYMDQNLHSYFYNDDGTPNKTRYKSSQTLALKNFDDLWSQLVKLCSDSSLGDAGKACISDRQRGACKWKQNNSDSNIPGLPAIGECYNSFNGGRDPIANDPDVQPDPSTTSATDTAASSGTTGGTTTSTSDYAIPLLLAGGVLAIWMAVK